MSELTKEVALRILKSRVIFNGPSKRTVKVTSVNPFEDKFIVNINAMNMYQAKEARALLAKDDYQGAINQNLSFNVLGTSERQVVRGEQIHVNTDNVKLKSGEVALLVTGWSAIPLSTDVVSFDFEDASKDVVEELANTESEFEATGK